MFAIATMVTCLIVAGRDNAIGDLLAMGLEQARALKARRFEAQNLARICLELALVEGRREEALSLVRQGFAASDETGFSV